MSSAIVAGDRNDRNDRPSSPLHAPEPVPQRVRMHVQRGLAILQRALN